MKNKDDNFHCFIPVNFEKGTKGSKEEGLVKVSGVISTADEDQQGEFLDPKGFDLTKFIKTGHINWNHSLRDSPEGYIGHPVSAKVIDGKSVYMEGVLYTELQKTQDILKLDSVLTKYGNGRKLGYSIEGKATERDPLNPKRILKAVITGVAITPTPVNQNTCLEIIKGWTNDSLEQDYDIQKSENPNGGEQYIIDITNPETGLRYMVKKDFSIKIEKAISTDSSAKGTIKEDVEKKPKSQIDFTDNEIRKSIIILSKAKELKLLGDNIIKKIQEKLK